LGLIHTVLHAVVSFLVLSFPSSFPCPLIHTLCIPISFHIHATSRHLIN
jgi:hypothetical protein